VAHGEGVPSMDGTEVGHHFVRLSVLAPKDVSERQRQLMLAFSASDETLAGAVDGLVTLDDHKFRNTVIEPSKVHREIGSAKEKVDKSESAANNDDPHRNEGFFSRLRRVMYAEEFAKKEASASSP